MESLLHFKARMADQRRMLRTNFASCLTNGGVRDRRFQFCTLLTDQRPRVRLEAGNVRNCARHAAAMVIVPKLEAILSPPVHREGMLIQ